MTNRKKRWVLWLEAGWRAMRPVFVFGTAVLLALGILSTLWQHVRNDYLAPADEGNSEIVVVQIPSGSSLSSIARILQKVGIIRNKGVFQYTAEFMDCASKLKAGTYELRRDMTNAEILKALMTGDGGQVTVTFTIPEGFTVEDIAATLVEKGVMTDSARFLELCRSGTAFADDYDFVAAVLASDSLPDRRYALEGYLFPDTYEVYAGTDEESIIEKMLTRMREIYVFNYIDKAEEMGYTMDEVVTLASIIEKEAKTADFSKVSAVFRNRLNKGMRLQSDATIKYVLKSSKLVLSDDDMGMNSPYNTFLIDDLPPGAISNPGSAAMEAVLFPDETLLEEGYYYFCNTDPESGVLAFAKTLQEHNENIAKYKESWLLWDAQNAN